MNIETRSKATQFLTDIAAQIEGATIDEDELSINVTRDGITARGVLRASEIRSGVDGDWHRKPTGKLSFRIMDGRYTTIKTYRERKDGSYNPALIAEIDSAAGAYAARQKNNNARQGAVEVARAALANMELATSRNLRAGANSNNEPTIKVSFEIGPIFLAATVKFMRFIGAIEDEPTKLDN